MPDQREQGPLDPAFAKFREQKVVEKLTEKLNGPKSSGRPEAAPSAPAVSVDELPSRAKVEEISLDDPEFGKFLTKRVNEAEAAEFDKDDARLVFGASPRGLAGEAPRLGSEEPAIKPAATAAAAWGAGPSPGPAPGAPKATPSAPKAVDPAPKAVVAPGPTKPAAAAPTPTAPPPPKPSAAGAAPAKPAAAAPPPKPVAPRPPRPVVADTEEPVAVPSLDLPPRPALSATARDDLAAQFLAVGTSLQKILGESSQRVLELRVASSEGLDRAISSFDSEARRVREYLERNEALASEAAAAAREAKQQYNTQDVLETKVVLARGRADVLVGRVAALREALAELESVSAKLEADVEERTTAVERTRSEVGSLTDRLAVAEGDVEDLERVRDRLQEGVERLYGIKTAHEEAIKRLKDMKDGLTKPVA